MYDNSLEEEEPFLFDEDKLGMRVTSGTLTIEKDEGNLIGISIGGGAPQCPCLYIVQVFDNTPASRDGTLESGDELVAVNGCNVKNKTKVEVAKMIQAEKERVVINYNKLHAEAKQGKSLDIVLKKMKHRIVDGLSSATADAFGLSRAILCNDSLVKKLDELEKVEFMYRGIVEHSRHMLKAWLEMSHVYKAFGDVFSEIGVREPHSEASKVFTEFGTTHRDIERRSMSMLTSIRPMLGDLNTFIHKAVPDTRLTIKKYADVKFEYLSYCLKVKEMDDEEYTYQALQEPLYRVETGNYEYRLILRCRQDARLRFAKLRSDVLVKMELLDQKHVQDIVQQLQRLISVLAKLHNECHSLLKEKTLFPIEMDLSTASAFDYPDPMKVIQDEEEEDEDEELVEDSAEEAVPELLHFMDMNLQTIPAPTEEPKPNLNTSTPNTNSYLDDLSEPLQPIGDPGDLLGLN